LNDCDSDDPSIRRHRSSVGSAVINVSAKMDYAVRAMCALAESPGSMSTGELADSQGLPRKFLEEVLNELRQSGVLETKRGAGGGYWCARSPSEISLADVARPFIGTLSQVRGEHPESGIYRPDFRR
jgi:Rrf2 family protein